jgi:alcohol dehydrogenase class IV
LKNPSDLNKQKIILNDAFDSRALDFVLTNTALKFKEGFATDYTYPKISILDPGLTESMPDNVTRDTAVDAMGHSFESYYSKKSNPFSDMVALNSIYLIFKYLPEALKNPKDREARSALMIAAALGGIAIDNCGVTTPHGVSMAIGGSFGTTHGQGVGIVLPFAVEKAKVIAAEKFSFMANYFGWSNSPDIRKNSELVVDKLKAFMDLIGFPSKLSQIGIKKENFDEIFDKVVNDEDIANDPGSYTPEEIKVFLKNII